MIVPYILVAYSLLFGVLKFHSNWLSPPLFFLMCSLVVLFFTHKSRDLFSGDLKKEVLWGCMLGLLPIAGMWILESVSPHIHSGKTWSNSKHIWLNLLVWAPLGEEFYFRGLLLPHLQKQMKPLLAIVFQALLFMFCHSAWALGPLSLGLINGYVFYKRKNIVACIIFHLLANTYGPLMLSYFPNAFHKLRMFYY